MPLVGFNASVSITGASVAMVTEAMTLVSGKTYLIDDAAKEIFDPATAITVFDNAVPVDLATDVDDIDLLHGTVTFDAGYAVTGPVTITGAHLPKSAVAQARSGSFAPTRVLIEKNVFGDDAMKRLIGIKDLSGTFQALDRMEQTVGGGDTFFDLLNDGTIFVFEFNPGAGDVYRARVLFETGDLAGEVIDQVTDDLSFNLAATESVDGFDMSSGWG